MATLDKLAFKISRNANNPCGEIVIGKHIMSDTNSELLTKSNLLTKIVSGNFELFKKSSGKLRNFFGIFNKVKPENFAICGGAVRDWWLLREPKDIDIVVDCPQSTIDLLARNFNHTRSQFNGYMFDVDGKKIDLWKLEDSWTFVKNSKIEKSWHNLIKSFPFDIDSVMVFGNGVVIENGFFNAMSRREIEISCLENKDREANIVNRALRFKEKYRFTFGPKLKTEIDKNKSAGNAIANIVSQVSTNQSMTQDLLKFGNLLKFESSSN